MRFGSVCSGIEAASVAWEVLGWSAAWFAEIEPFPSAVLAHRFPDVMNVGDMTNIAYLVKNGFIEAPDVLVGGTPCQAFSVAGQRASLDDDRGQLSLEYCRILDAIDEVKNNECVAVWENVPGVLSTKDNAFGCFLGELSGAGGELFPTGTKWANSGYIIGPKRQVAWRVLDAQFFGVAQRRRRVFVIASARKGFDPSEILFEFEGVRRDSPPSRSPREDTARGTQKGFAESSFGNFRPTVTDGGTLKQSGGNLGGGSETLIVGTLDTQCGYEKAAFQSVMSGHIVVHATQDPILNNNLAFPLGRNSGQENGVYALQGNTIGRQAHNGGNGLGASLEISPTLTTADRHGVAYSVIGDVTPKVGENVCMTLRAQGGGGIVPPSVKPPPVGVVRRLTPIECERLQGFPDDWTKIPYKGKSSGECPDGPRYAACGNSMAVPVMRWLGSRIDNYVTNK